MFQFRVQDDSVKLLSILKIPFTAFLLKAFSLYIAWYVIYEMWLHPAQTADLWVIDNLITVSSAILRLIGYKLIDYPYNPALRTMGIDGSHGMWIGDPCNGLTLFALFAGFVIAYPGSLIKKIIFISAGIFTIHVFNIFRIVGLALVSLYFPDFLELNHTYTFTILIYSIIFFLWYLWAVRFSQ